MSARSSLNQRDAGVLEGVNELESSAFPSLHQSKEGWLRHQENVAKPPKLTQSGWFSDRPAVLFSIGKPPRPRDQRRLRGIFLIARPPLLF